MPDTTRLEFTAGETYRKRRLAISQYPTGAVGIEVDYYGTDSVHYYAEEWVLTTWQEEMILQFLARRKEEREQ